MVTEMEIDKDSMLNQSLLSQISKAAKDFHESELSSSYVSTSPMVDFNINEIQTSMNKNKAHQ